MTRSHLSVAVGDRVVLVDGSIQTVSAVSSKTFTASGRVYFRNGIYTLSKTTVKDFVSHYNVDHVLTKPKAGRYGCHNRPDFATLVSNVPDGYATNHDNLVSTRLVSIPFKMARDCQYTLTELGAVDERCHDCKHQRK